MLNKIVLILIILSFPAFANAWYVNSKTSPLTGQGTISPAGNQTYANGSPSGEYTVTPAPGYSIARVTIDGAQAAPNANGKYVVPYVYGKTWRYIVAYFTGSNLSITTNISGSGAIREDTSESLTNIPPGANRQLLVIPNPGWELTSLTASGTPDITVNNDGSRTVVYNNLQTSQTVAATFTLIPVVTASAGNDVTAFGEGATYAATLYGSATSNQGAITYAWSGSGLNFGTPNAGTTTVWAATPGTYTATLTVTSGALTRTDEAVVTVLNRIAYLESLCTQCHAGTHPAVVSAYDGGGHKTKGVSCQACHDPGNGGHYSVKAPLCATCHTALPHGTRFPDCANCHDAHSGGRIGGGSISHNAIEPSEAVCGSCHSAAPHFGGVAYTANGQVPPPKAQFVSTDVTCDKCHADSVFSANRAILSQFSSSGHGNPDSEAWAHYDWRAGNRSACARCHNGTAFVAKLGNESNTDWIFTAEAVGKPGEVLNCSACHTNLTTGALRTPGAYTETYNDGASYTFPNVGESNLCLRCHSGRESGKTIKNTVSDTGNLGFINSHYLAAGGLIFYSAGYQYDGLDYSFDGYAHDRAGASSGRGPCVYCHMGNGTANHSWSLVTKDSSGTITSITSNACISCHFNGHTYTAAELNNQKNGFEAALDALEARLAAKGIHYYPASPYFFTAPYVPGGTNTAFTKWADPYGLQAWKDVMGAAFNLNLLRHEPGAYAHNRLYARRLIYDSINLIDNGLRDSTVNLSDYPAAANYLKYLSDPAAVPRP